MARPKKSQRSLRLQKRMQRRSDRLATQVRRVIEEGIPSAPPEITWVADEYFNNIEFSNGALVRVPKTHP